MSGTVWISSVPLRCAKGAEDRPIGNRGVSMTDQVWVSRVMSNYQIGMKQGLRAKFYGQDWNPAEFVIPLPSDQVSAASERHFQGETLERSDFTEAAAVWAEKNFSRVKDIFTAGPFYAVKGKLADVLSRFDLGAGGLIPFTIYRADLVTPLEEKFFLLNFGGPKDSFAPEESNTKCTRQMFVDKQTGRPMWDVNPHAGGDLALSPAALEGADLWCEKTVFNTLFMSDALAAALRAAKIKIDFELMTCRIVEPAQ